MGLFDLFKKKPKDNNMEPIDGIPPSTWLPTPPPVYDYDRSTQAQSHSAHNAEPVQKVTANADDDFNPLDLNSIISWYKRQKPDATEEDIVDFVKQLAKPAEDQDHLTAEGDLPWGWHRVHKDEIQKIESEYKRYWKAWFDSRSKSPAEYMPNLEAFVNCMGRIKRRCASFGECFDYWCSVLFTDEYLEKLQNELANMKVNVDELEAAYQKKQAFEQNQLPNLSANLIEIIKANPGIMQKDIYKLFPLEAKNYIQEKLYYAEKANKIIREKCGNSYKLYIKNKTK